MLTARKLPRGKLHDVELGLRGVLRGFGLKLGQVGKAWYEARVRELVAGQPMLEALAEAMLRAHAALKAEFAALHRRLLGIVREDAVRRRLMTVPGVGAVVAVTFKTAIDDPGRFKRSKEVGSYLGPTPRKYRSGETDWTGRISKVGDAMARTALYEAATVPLGRVARFSVLKAWAMGVAKHQGIRKARVALARKLAIVLHRMWVDGKDFRPSKEEAVAA